MAPSGLDALAGQLIAQHACAHEGVLQVQLVNSAHENQIGRAGWARQVVHRSSAHAEQLGLVRDGQLVVTVDSIALRSAIPLW